MALIYFVLLTFEIIYFVELKNHRFFKGVDWKSVTKRRSKPPFESIGMKMKFNNSKSITDALEMGYDGDIDASSIERFCSKLRLNEN